MRYNKFKGTIIKGQKDGQTCMDKELYTILSNDIFDLLEKKITESSLDYLDDAYTIIQGKLVKANKI